MLIENFFAIIPRNTEAYSKLSFGITKVYVFVNHLFQLSRDGTRSHGPCSNTDSRQIGLTTS